MVQWSSLRSMCRYSFIYHDRIIVGFVMTREENSKEWIVCIFPIPSFFYWYRFYRNVFPWVLINLCSVSFPWGWQLAHYLDRDFWEIETNRSFLRIFLAWSNYASENKCIFNGLFERKFKDVDISLLVLTILDLNLKM